MKNLMGEYFKEQTKIYQLDSTHAYKDLDKMINSLERIYLKEKHAVLPEEQKESRKCIGERLQKNIILEKENEKRQTKEKISELNQKFFIPNKINKAAENLLSIHKQIEKNLHLCGTAAKETGESFKINNYLTKDVIEVRPANTKEGYSLFVNGIHQSISSTAANIEKGKGFVIGDASGEIKKVVKEGMKVAAESTVCPPKAASEIVKSAGEKAAKILEKAAVKGIQKEKAAVEQGAKVDSKER